MTAAQKVELPKVSGICFSCLNTGHRSSQCKVRKICGIDECERLHHSSLYQGSVEGIGFHTMGSPRSGGCLLQMMKIESACENSNPLIVLFDGGVTISLIRFDTAAKLGLHGEEVMLSVSKKHTSSH